MLSLHPGEGDLGEAPVRFQIGISHPCDDGLAGAQFSVESAFPTATGLNTGIGIKIEKDGMVIPAFEAVFQSLDSFAIG